MAIDLFQTLLGLAGLDLPRDRVIDGRDLAGLLTGRETENPHEALFFFNPNIVDGARSGRWKYYRSVHLYTWPTPLDEKSTLAGRWVHANRYTDPQTGEVIARSTHDPLLFDVVADRDESHNVVSRHPDEAARLPGTFERHAGHANRMVSCSVHADAPDPKRP